jgi:uncharacterized membrane protein YdbT with pleckstrin-like domain
MATYVDSILEPGEIVRYRTTVSWIVYVPSILLAVIALATLVAGVNLHDMKVLLWGGAVLFALTAVSNFISAWFRRRTTEIAVTDRRVILKHGFISRATMEMNLAKVESIDVDQTLTGRLFNYGNVTIRGTGSSLETLRMIDEPLKLRTTVTTS